jgi:hypothetical protein
VTALQQFYGRPFPLSPGEEETFDTLYISNAFGLIDGLQAYGNFYHPRTWIEDAGIINSYNTWEYFKKTITSQEITSVLNNLGNFATSGRFHRPFIKYFVPDDGWYIDKGGLREGNVATDVLTNAQYPIGTGGSLTIQLNPHQSACLLVPAFGGF